MRFAPPTSRPSANPNATSVPAESDSSEPESIARRASAMATRVVAAAIEQNHDARGIIWPDAIAPFRVVVVPLNASKSPRVRETADKLYSELLALGVDVLLDDRDERPGVKFADSELIGIPHRVVVGDRGLEAGKLEYRQRRAEAAEEFPAGDALAFLRGKLGL